MIIEKAKFNTNYIVVYKDYSELQKKKIEVSDRSKKNLIQNSQKKYNGELSHATQKKIKQYVSILLLSLKYSKQRKRKASFVTLTLPFFQCHDDNFIKRNLLNRFIIQCQRKFDVKNYVWRAETQRNGNIHFHFVFDASPNWHQLRWYWNQILNDFGYIDGYRNEQKSKHGKGFYFDFNISHQIGREKYHSLLVKQQKTNLSYASWDWITQVKAWEKGEKENWSDPNSTDLKNLKTVSNVGAYISKYMSKDDDQRRKVGGRIWGSSSDLKDKKIFTLDLAFHEFGRTYTNSKIDSLLSEVSKELNVKVVNEEHFSLLISKQDIASYLKKHDPYIYSQYTNYYYNIYSEIYL